MSAISYFQAKDLTLARLRKVMSEMPVSERGMPRYVLGDPVTGVMRNLSVLDLIREVEGDTALGRNYVYSEARLLGYVIAG